MNRMNKLISMCFKAFSILFVNFLTGTTKAATTILPHMLHGSIAQVALLVGKLGADRIFAIRHLTTIKASST